jgi:hypothetical protein
LYSLLNLELMCVNESNPYTTTYCRDLERSMIKTVQISIAVEARVNEAQCTNTGFCPGQKIRCFVLGFVIFCDDTCTFKRRGSEQ